MNNKEVVFFTYMQPQTRAMYDLQKINYEFARDISVNAITFAFACANIYTQALLEKKPSEEELKAKAIEEELRIKAKEEQKAKAEKEEKRKYRASDLDLLKCFAIGLLGVALLTGSAKSYEIYNHDRMQAQIVEMQIQNPAYHDTRSFCQKVREDENPYNWITRPIIKGINLVGTANLCSQPNAIYTANNGGKI